MPYVKENKDWQIVELLDGFKSHENVLDANELRALNKVTSLKEESNTSHANQGYNQFVAKNDKKVAAETLYEQRKLEKWRTGKTNIDQYDLVVTGLAIVNATTPEMWTTSFVRCNLDPRTRLSFPDWVSPFYSIPLSFCRFTLTLDTILTAYLVY